jgi:hypothetical protein
LLSDYISVFDCRFGCLEFFTAIAFSSAKGLVLDVGITMRYFLGAAIFVTGCLLFQTRSLEGEHNHKKVLLGGAVGFTIVAAKILHVPMVRGIERSIPSIIDTGLVAVLSCFSGLRLNLLKSV